MIVIYTLSQPELCQEINCKIQKILMVDTTHDSLG